MADSDKALIGTYPCGCVTMAIADPPKNLSKMWRDAITDHIADGGSIEHTTVGEAKARDHFLPASCPNCHKGRGEQMDALTYSALCNSGRDPDGACSRACALQLEHLDRINSVPGSTAKEG